MSVSTHIYLLRDPNSTEHKNMVTALKALKDIGVSELPEKLATYFETPYAEEVYDEGYLKIGHMSHGSHYSDEISGVVEYNDEMRSGFEVFVKELPPEVDIIRFYNSY